MWEITNFKTSFFEGSQMYQFKSAQLIPERDFSFLFLLTPTSLCFPIFLCKEDSSKGEVAIQKVKTGYTGFH